MPRWQEYDWDLMVRKRAPVPLVAAALLLALWLATAERGSIAGVKCRADHEARIADIEARHGKAMERINLRLAAARESHRIEALEALRDQAWAEDDARRGDAQRLYGACLDAARRAG